MDATTAIVLISAMKEITLLFMELHGKEHISKEELVAKTPEEILKELGIGVAEKKDDSL